MAKRKTFNVSDILDVVNGICKDSAPDRSDVRQGAMNVLEHILHESGNYQGFRYLLQDECTGQPGCRYKDGQLLPYPERFENTDKTRVQYF